MDRTRRYPSFIQVEVQLHKYINDAAALASGKPMNVLSCWLDGIKTPEELAQEIKLWGSAYLEQAKKIAMMPPVVRGETISAPAMQEIPANTPSKEDQEFLSRCLRQLRKQRWVAAADADIYEKIVGNYPQYAHPPRVRGAEARRWLALHDDDAVVRSIKKMKKFR